MTAEQAAIDAARRAGLEVTCGHVVAAGANVVVRFDPGPVAARVAGLSARMRDSFEMHRSRGSTFATRLPYPYRVV